MRLKNIMGVAAAALTCLVAAGCGGGPPPPASFDAVQGMSCDQAWQSGFADAMAGDKSAETTSVAYQAGFKAGTDFKEHPSGAPPANSCKPPTGYVPPTAGGGG